VIGGEEVKVARRGCVTFWKAQACASRCGEHSHWDGVTPAESQRWGWRIGIGVSGAMDSDERLAASSLGIIGSDIICLGGGAPSP
jgi:hypothetical protein